MYGSPAMPCFGGGCLVRLDLWRLRGLLILGRNGSAVSYPMAVFSMGGGYLDGLPARLVVAALKEALTDARFL